MVYLVSYDLKYPGQDYTDLIREIKALGSWAKPLESLWLVNTSLTTSDILNRLTALDRTDKLLVIHITTPWSSLHLSQEVVDWMKQSV